jgi:hypothetical protein
MANVDEAASFLGFAACLRRQRSLGFATVDLRQRKSNVSVKISGLNWRPDTTAMGAVIFAIRGL